MSTKEEVNELKELPIGKLKEEFNELVTKLQEIFPHRKYNTQKFCTRKLILFRNTYDQAMLKENKVKAKNHRASKIEEFRLRSIASLKELPIGKPKEMK